VAKRFVPSWTPCKAVNCVGSPVQSDMCVVHLAEQDPEVFDAELKRIGQQGNIDARGVKLPFSVLKRLLEAAPREPDGRVLAEARFEGATFLGEAPFNGITFQGPVNFNNATFEAYTSFSWATFKDIAEFNDVTFHGEAWFEQAAFERPVWFLRTDFHLGAWFGLAIFHDLASFIDAQFHHGVVFSDATFRDVTYYGQAIFHRGARFSGAIFQGDAGFSGSSFQREAWFDGTHFAQTRQFGPVLVGKQLDLDRAVFLQRVQIEAAAGAVCCQRAQFRAGVQFRLRWATITLSDADLAAPSILTSVPPLSGLDENAMSIRWRRLRPSPRGLRWRARLLSVERADVADLRINNVDLRPCRFGGAHNLDRIRIEGAPLLAPVPGWWRARRATVVEEQQWRAARLSGHRGWYPSECHPPGGGLDDLRRVPEPIEVAAVYRDLRKGREDAKDAPGAADFYYGEMEMRRHAAPRWSVERALLIGYWLVSGYALRAWRAFVALGVVITIAAVLFAWVGFKPSANQFVPVKVGAAGQLVYHHQPVARPSFQQQLPAAFGYSAEVATSLLRGPERRVTVIGEWTQAGLRWLGPVLFALALVSLRGRIKR
jgi:uncharacterized protein YjbI with pentapeptide repeats